MNTFAKAAARAAAIVACYLVAPFGAVAQAPQVGPNINMIQGTTWPAGDPMLTKQNEPSLAVSSLHPLHIIAGVNDYRLVDPVFSLPDEEGGDAWVTVLKSIDGGISWHTSLIPGCPLSIPQCGTSTNPIKAANLQFAADPTVRAGPYGTFFYSFIAGNRDSAAGGVTAIQRIIDRNDNVKFDSDPVYFDVANVID